MLQQKHRIAKILLGITSCFIVSILSLLAIINRQYVIDQITVWQYKPVGEVATLVDKAGMNDLGRFMFYASQPILDGTQDFNSECDRVEIVTSILGCFNNYRIYLYDVTDPQLDGIREVTATHETLHAVYVRMGENERKKINALLDTEYAKLQDDKDFKDLIAYYDRTEPGQRYNELHSIIGTEVADVSQELENYYSRYFSDRQKAIDLNAKYTSVFKKLNAKAEQISNELNALSQDISHSVAKYNSDIQSLNSDISLFNSRASGSYFKTQTQFDRERAVLVVRSENLEYTKVKIQNDIKKYDSLVIEYNSIASQSKKLSNSIDSTLAPAPSI